MNGEMLSTNNLKTNVINNYMAYHIGNYLLMSKFKHPSTFLIKF